MNIRTETIGFSTGQHDAHEGWIQLTASLNRVLPVMLPLDGFSQRVNAYSDSENVGCYVYFPEESHGQTTALWFEDLLKRDMGDVVSISALQAICCVLLDSNQVFHIQLCYRKFIHCFIGSFLLYVPLCEAPPPHLIVSLNRFTHNTKLHMLVKLHTHVDIKLVRVIDHEGDSRESGHYRTHVLTCANPFRPPPCTRTTVYVSACHYLSS
jgi:hypothetical protein